MKSEFLAYLKSIDIGDPLTERIKNIYDFYTDICSIEIKDIFVSEYIKEDGSREYESLWFFSDDYAMEAKQFIIQEKFDSAIIKNKINRWDLIKLEFDCKKANNNSRIMLQINFYPIEGSLKASKENCEHLLNIFKKYVLTNMKK